MLNRRQFLTRTLQGSSLLALHSVVPQFLVNTAQAAEAGKDTVLVVIEMTGGNDGLNTVIPYADDFYHKARPTLRITKEQAIRVNDSIGLNPALRGFDQLLQKSQLAIVQGVGYPNPDRSHFESMDIWQSAELGKRNAVSTGWVARSVADLQDKRGNVPVMQLGAEKLPLALQGAPSGIVTINNQQAFQLNFGKKADPARQKARQQLLRDLAQGTDSADQNSLLPFVQRRELQTYTTLERLQELLKDQRNNQGYGFDNLTQKLQLVSQMIQRGFGARVFYLAIDGFDTHADQAAMHPRLLQELSNAVNFFFNTLQGSGQDKRVLVMTFSEFGRRVQENGSKGTDHGSGSCLFVAGPGVKGGPVGKHPSLNPKELDYEASIADRQSGDLKFHTDFRQVYATLLDGWLGVDSKTVLGAKFEHLDMLKAKG
jgi:uncharacterized protein (DUF1501 family)